MTSPVSNFAETATRERLALRDDVPPREAQQQIDRAIQDDRMWASDVCNELQGRIMLGLGRPKDPTIKANVQALVGHGMAGNFEALEGWNFAETATHSVLLAPGQQPPPDSEVTPARSVVETFVRGSASARANGIAQDSYNVKAQALEKAIEATQPGSPERKLAEDRLADHLTTPRNSLELGLDVSPPTSQEKAHVAPHILAPFLNANPNVGLTSEQVKQITGAIERGDLTFLQSHFLVRCYVRGPSADPTDYRMVTRLVAWTPGMVRPTEDTLGPGAEAVTLEEFTNQYAALAATLRRSWGPAWSSAFGFKVRKRSGLYSGFESADFGGLAPKRSNFMPVYEATR
jgi:hypothetical protein